MKDIEINEKQFKIYEKIRQSGATNMFMIWQVKKIAKEQYHFELDKNTILQIMRRYSHYKELFAKKPLKIEVKDLDIIDEQSANDIILKEEKIEGGEEK